MIIKNNIISGFNRGAKTYNQAASLQARIAEKLATKFSDSPATHILEIGCGTGLLSQHLVNHFPASNLYLTDIADAMIQQCSQRITQSDKIKFICMDGEVLQDLPAFDLIVSSMTMHWFTQLHASIQQLKQKLKQGGRFVFAMLTDKSLHEWRTLCNESKVPFATPAFPAYAELKIQQPDITWHVDEIIEPYANLQTFLQSLKALGAIAPRADYQQISGTLLRRMMRQFNARIDITYEVAYGEYQCR